MIAAYYDYMKTAKRQQRCTFPELEEETGEGLGVTSGEGLLRLRS